MSFLELILHITEAGETVLSDSVHAIRTDKHTYTRRFTDTAFAWYPEDM